MRLKIGTKIGIVFFIFFVEIFFFMLIFSFIFRERELYMRGLHDDMETLDLVKNLQLALAEVIMPVNDFLIPGADPNEPEKFEILSTKVENLINGMEKLHFDRYEERELFAYIREKYSQIKEITLHIFSIPNPIGNIEAGRLMEKTDRLADAAIADAKKLHHMAHGKLGEAQVAWQKTNVRLNVVALITVLSNIILTLAGIVFFRRTISSPLISLRDTTLKVGKGNLETRTNVRQQDEIGELSAAFNKMTEDLQTSHNALVQEIAERKKVEEALLENKRSLEEVNRELQESQVQLVQSEKMAGLGQLAAGVAHEINNPVGFVLSNLGTLTEYVGTFRKLLGQYDALVVAVQNGKKEEEKAIVSRIKETCKEDDLPYILEDVDNLLSETRGGTNRVKEIVRSLKSFARVDEAQEKETNINDCIEETLKIVWNELKYKCKVHKKLGEIPSVRCYPGQLNQVFMNLLVNAAQAIPERGDITIETGANDTHIIIRISDTGNGIIPEHLSKIFDPFFTTKELGKGTGLGLSISHGIVQKHNGAIEAQSEVNKGTTFTIRLPIQGVNS